jgi:hypothetical protein
VRCRLSQYVSSMEMGQQAVAAWDAPPERLGCHDYTPV